LPIVYPVIFTPRARAELIDAQDWYENEVPGLGQRFRMAVDAVVQRMGATPQQFPVIYKNVRRALLRRFPYALMFVIEAD
jgi:plasmid stabilization system protein ParE